MECGVDFGDHILTFGTQDSAFGIGGIIAFAAKLSPVIRRKSQNIAFCLLIIKLPKASWSQSAVKTPSFTGTV